MELKKGFSILSLVSLTILTVFMLALAIKGLGAISDAGSFSFVSSVKDILVAQIVFSIIILLVILSFLIKNSGVNFNETSPSRGINVIWFFLSLMTIVQFFILLGIAKDSIDSKQICAFILCIFSTVIFATGYASNEENRNASMGIAGILLYLFAEIISIQLETYTFNFVDVVMIVSIINSLSYFFIAKSGNTSSSIVINTENVKSHTSNVLNNQVTTNAKIIKKEAIITSTYFYYDNDQANSIAKDTKVQVVKDNGDNTYTIKYKDGKATKTLQNVNGFYLKIKSDDE